MSITKPVELGRVSAETKEMGPGPADNPFTPIGPNPV
jgi:hypothetical protein